VREPAAIELETRGLLALRQGDPDAAAVAYAQAVRVWQLLGLTVWQARAERLRSDALVAAGRRSAASASARRSKAILARIRSPLEAIAT
jgi:predicted negative regulator of RcsB-dependent stress response